MFEVMNLSAASLCGHNATIFIVYDDGMIFD